MSEKLVIEKGVPEDCGQLAKLYDDLNDYLEMNTNYPGWKKGVYPTEEDAAAGINEQKLFTVRIDGELLGSFILRSEPEEAYSLADWGNDFDYKDIYVIHTFALHPKYLHCGFGSRIIKYIIHYAAENGIKALRLDTYEKNTPAIRLYEKCGFNYIGTVDMGYSEIGLDAFKLYQYII